MRKARLGAAYRGPQQEVGEKFGLATATVVHCSQRVEVKRCGYPKRPAESVPGFYDRSRRIVTRLFMVSGDRGLAAGEHGPFHWLLEQYHRHWERIDVVCPKIPEVSNRYPFDNVTLHPAPCGRLWHPRFVATIARSLPDPPSLIVSHDYGLFRNGAGARLVQQELGIPWVSEIHHVDGHPRAATVKARLQLLLTRHFVTRASSSVTAFRVVCNQVAELLQSWGVPAAKTLLLSSLYLDLEQYSPGPDNQRDIDVLFCGRLEAEKGPQLLLATLAALSKQRPDFRATVIGRGSGDRRWRRRLHTLGLDKVVEHRAWLEDQSELIKLYQRSKVLLCTSYAEGNPRVVAEAMACGAVVVSTPVGRVPELIDNGRNGRVCDWNETELATAINEILGQEPKRHCMAERAPAAVAAFERSEMIAHMAETYNNLARAAS